MSLGKINLILFQSFWTSEIGSWIFLTDKFPNRNTGLICVAFLSYFFIIVKILSIIDSSKTVTVFSLSNISLSIGRSIMIPCVPSYWLWSYSSSNFSSKAKLCFCSCLLVKSLALQLLLISLYLRLKSSSSMSY